MKITLLEVENYKKVKKIVIAPGERSTVLIGGKNKQGKSSLIGAMSAALGGVKEAADVPIRKGEKSSDIKIELDDGALIIHRRFLESGNSSLEVKSKDGKLSSPQKILDRLVGTRFLDPIKFTRLTEKEQREVLLSCVDLGDFSIEKHDKERKATFEERTDVNRDIKRLVGELDATPMPDAIPHVPDQKLLMTQLDALKGQLAQRDKASDDLVRMREIVTQRKSRIDLLKTELAGLEEELSVFIKNGKELREKTDAYEQIDWDAHKIIIDATAEEISDSANAIAESTRLTHQSERHQALAERLKAANLVSEGLTEKIERMDKAKVEKLAAAGMPIPNLSIDEDKVIYAGVPLSQASGAEQLQVSLAIASALSPELRDIWVQDGALLDLNSLEIVDKFAKDNDLRIWLERVGESDDDAVIIEEGVVKT